MPWGEIILAVLGLVTTILIYIFKKKSKEEKIIEENEKNEKKREKREKEISDKLREDLKTRNQKMRKQRQAAEDWDPE